MCDNVFMIARLRGEVLEYDGAMIVVDCQGVGYGVHVCFDEQQSLKLGNRCDLYIAERLKEDAHELYGFSSRTRKQLFDLLTSVNGIGPKAALAILNVGSEPQVRAAIASGDTKFISMAKGVGKKVAERAVVDLKNKVGLVASLDATGFLGETLITDEAAEALVALGYSAHDAMDKLRGIDTALGTQERVKQALRVKK